MKRHPLVTVFLSLTAGIIVASMLRIKRTPSWALLVVLISAITLAGLEFFSPFDGSAIGLLGLVFFGIAFYGWSYFNPADLYPELRSISRVRGQVVSYPKATPSGSEFVLRPSGYRGKLKVFLGREGREAKEVNYGDRLTVKGDFAIPGRTEDFNYRDYLRKRRIWGVVYRGKVEDLKAGTANPVLEFGWGLRRIVSRRLERLFRERDDFLRALLFGVRDALGEETESSFTDTGLAHLLAASGLHLGIIIGMSWWMLSRFGLNRGTIYLLSLPLLFGYLALVGFSLPILRAGLIYLFGGARYLLVRLGLILDSWYDRYQSLAGAALVLVLLNPASISTAGFQLSFGATFALALFYDPLEELLQLRPEYLNGVLAASIAAQLGVTPVLAVHFHQAHPLAPVINLVAIPGVTAILYLGILSVVLGGTAVYVPGLLPGLRGIISGLRRLVMELSDLPGTSIGLVNAGPLGLLAYFILLFWLKRVLTERNERYLYLN